MRPLPYVRFVALTVLAVISVSASEGHTLFDPVPSGELREFDPDRPDKTDSPFTVDAGHLQLEVAVVDVSTRRGDSGERETSTGYLETTLRVGLSNRLEAQLSVEPSSVESTGDEFGEGNPQRRGPGDTIARLKANWWGDDGGTTALGSMVYAHIPTSRTGSRSRPGFGLLVPFAVTIEHVCAIEPLIGMDVSDDGERYRAAWIASTSVSRDITERLSMYLEVFARRSSEATAATLDAGGVWLIAHDLAIDLGVARGITRAAEDWGGTTGISRHW